MRLAALSFWVAFSVGFAAAAAAEPAAVLTDSTALPAPGPGAAMLVLAREELAPTTTRRSKPDNLMLDGRPLGILPPRSFMAAVLDPGVHCLSGVPESPDLRFEIGPGQSALLRLREMVTPEDRPVADWLFDDVSSVQALIRDRKLKKASTTESGERKLARISTARPGDCGRPGTVDAANAPDSSFDRMWYENPLNSVSLKSDFFSDNGVLRVVPDGVHYESKARRVDIPADRIRRIHFGGTRYTGTAPWLDVDWADGDSTHVSSFADSRPAQAVQSYNRLYRAIAHLMGGTTAAEPESLRLAPRR